MSERSAGTSSYIAELDGLRGIAILAVMVHRMYPRAGDTPWPVEAGWAGVDLFFVISGFLIAGILIDARGEPGFFRNFYARRVLRIFPLFYLLIGGMLLAFPIAHHDEFLRQAGSPLWYLFQLGNIPESLLGRDPPYWLAPVWSLAIEEQFYWSFPILVHKVEPRRLARWLAATAALALIVRLVTTELVPDRERLQYLFTLCRLDTIAIGCLLAVFVRSTAYRAWRDKLPRVLIPVIAVTGAIEIATQFDRTTWFGRTFGYSVLAIGLGALVLLTYEYRGRVATGLLRNIVLRYPGKLCFGLYLLHRPADTAVTALVSRLGLDDASLVWLPVKIAVALGFATVSWWVVEQPFLRLKSRFSSKAQRLVTAAPAVATLAALFVLFSGCRQEAGVIGNDLMPRDAAAADARPVGCDAAIDAYAGMPADSATPADSGSPRDSGHDAAMADSGSVLIDAGMPPIDSAPPPPPPVDSAPMPLGHVIYPQGQLMSPITSDVAAAMMAIAGRASAAEQVFGKVGDSMTASTSFLNCFDSSSANLGSHTDLASTLTFFQAGNAGGTTPFSRTSLAATGGWTAADVLAGSPAPIDKELAAIDPRYAVTQLGTNDVRTGRTLAAFGADLLNIVDRECAHGAIPILSTIPTMPTDADSNARIPLFNGAIRAIAQGRSLPLIDFQLALSSLANQGIGTDGIHPTVDPAGACILTDDGLRFGYNVRNLLTLEALDRTRQARAGTALDATAPRRAGSGSHADPFRSQLPLADMADTRTGDAGFASYPKCGVSDTGHEIVYRLDLTAATAISAFVISRAPVDIDVTILAGSLSASACVAGGDLSASAPVGPGTVYIAVDGRSADSDGEFALIIQAQ